jgi:hypothetical protein
MAVVFGYLTHGRRGTGSGMRVFDDGRVELCIEGGEWQPITTLSGAALAELSSAVEASGVRDLPERTPRPANIRDGDTVELWAGDTHALFEGWADGNPAAVPSRELVMELSRLVTAAQAGA